MKAHFPHTSLALGFVLLLSLGAGSDAALGYGTPGHEIVGAIADKLLAGTIAETHVKALLGTQTLEYASTWADKVKYAPRTAKTNAYILRNPHHDRYHYTDIPISLPAYKDGLIGSSDTDVVHSLDLCMAVLRGGMDTAQITQVEALKLLIHLVGDIHQPLHVGAGYLDENGTLITPASEEEAKETDTRGGNNIEFRSVNLHSYWDRMVVDNAMRISRAATPREFAGILTQHEPAGWRTGPDANTWSRAWATEMIPLARKAYSDLRYSARTMVTQTYNGTSTVRPGWRASASNNDAYDRWAASVVTKCLAEAGYRLADLLESIWP